MSTRITRGKGKAARTLSKAELREAELHKRAMAARADRAKLDKQKERKEKAEAAKKKKSGPCTSTEKDGTGKDPEPFIRLTQDQFDLAVKQAMDRGEARGKVHEQQPPAKRPRVETIEDQGDDEENEMGLGSEYGEGSQSGDFEGKSPFDVHIEKWENKRCITLANHVEKGVLKKVLEGEFTELHELLPPLFGTHGRKRKQLPCPPWKMVRVSPLHQYRRRES